MEIEADSPTKRAGEREVDFSVVQLLETSASFRRWLVSQTNPQLKVEKYLGGVIHASYAGEGESDIEFGFLTAEGNRHLVMIENKIDAVLQPDQIERYHKRGQFRINRDDWDSFTVCLVAPESYVSGENEARFDSVIRYEEILDYLDKLTHDSAQFFQEVLESAMRKSNTSDESDVLRAIADHVRNRTGIPHLHQSVSLKKRVAFRSNHPKHPVPVQYDVYIADTGDYGRTNVRLQIASAEELTDEKRETIKSIVSQHMDSLPDYEWRPDRKKNIAEKKVWHEDAVQDSSFESYPDAIADELLTLTETFHPLFIRNPVR